MIDPKKRPELFQETMRQMLKGPEAFVNEVIDTIDDMADLIERGSTTIKVLHEMVCEYGNTIDELTVEVDSLEATLRAAQHRIDGLERMTGSFLLYVN